MYAALALLLLATVCSAQKNYNPLPPQVQFISDGKFVGTLRTQVGSLPTRGSIVYLAGKNDGDTEYEKREVILEFGLEQTNTWEVETPEKIDTWEVASIDPETCFHQTFSEGDGSYPDCTPWLVDSRGVFFQNCTIHWDIVDVADLSVAVVLSPTNQLVEYHDQIFLLGQFVEGETVRMASQGTAPPSPSDFARPSVCENPTNPLEEDDQ